MSLEFLYNLRSNTTVEYEFIENLTEGYIENSKDEKSKYDQMCRNVYKLSEDEFKMSPFYRYEYRLSSQFLISNYILCS